MIQIFDVLGKDYNSIKDSIIKTDFTPDDLELLSKIGGIPPISEAKFNDDLYFFNFKIEKYKLIFLKNKIFQLYFAENKNKTLEIIDYLIKLEDFKFQFFTKNQIEETEGKSINDNDKKNGFTEFKTQCFEFDESSEFEIDNLDKYELITFRSNNGNVIIKEEFVQGDQFYIFELSPQIHKIFEKEDFII